MDKLTRVPIRDIVKRLPAKENVHAMNNSMRILFLVLFSSTFAVSSANAAESCLALFHFGLPSMESKIWSQLAQTGVFAEQKKVQRRGQCGPICIVNVLQASLASYRKPLIDKPNELANSLGLPDGVPAWYEVVELRQQLLKHFDQGGLQNSFAIEARSLKYFYDLETKYYGPSSTLISVEQLTTRDLISKRGEFKIVGGVFVDSNGDFAGSHYTVFVHGNESIFQIVDPSMPRESVFLFSKGSHEFGSHTFVPYGRTVRLDYMQALVSTSEPQIYTMHGQRFTLRGRERRIVSFIPTVVISIQFAEDIATTKNSGHKKWTERIQSKLRGWIGLDR